ncbi:MAG TPA: hypothetical protein VI874_01060, partial [Candidatus Norongarragalinales archaeon]|nr:hypothetical protein [Candidatus Norongarragalinales archaeon]
MKTVQVTEGSMRLFVPEESLTPPHKAAVFYNPNMAENRALSSLALGALLPDLNGSVLLDGFCACGARGIRYALDNFLSKIVFLDANPDAMALARKNAKTNGILDAVFFEGFFEDYPDKADVVEVD